MSPTHLSLHYHIIFGTKNHEPLIQPEWRGDLHAYLGGIIRTAGGIAESVGGVSDHVHMLIGLRTINRLADVLRDLKSVLLVGCMMILACVGSHGRKVMGHLQSAPPSAQLFGRYIERQEEHHRTHTFHEEYLELLRRSGVEFDERFI